MSRDSISPSRCLVVWLAATVVAAALVAWLLPDVGAHLPPRPHARFDDVLVGACEVAASAGLAWLWLVTTVVAADAFRGRAGRERAGIPPAVRRLVLGACGVALASGAVVTPSYAGEHRPAHGSDRVLAGLPLPDRPTALSHVAAVFDHAPDARQGDRPTSVAVQAGDTLWDLAARTLPPHAPDAAVAARWHRLYDLNRAVIGEDPDLIRPGQLLVLPTLEEDS